MNISYDTSIKALNKGFDYRSIIDKLIRNKLNIVSQAELQTGLRKKGIFVEVFESSYEYILLVHYKDENKNRVELWDTKGPYKTYEEALEIGLNVGLMLS